MKKVIIVLIFLTQTLYSGDYLLSIDGNPIELDLMEEIIYTNPDGVEFTVKLDIKEYISYEAQLFSFKHNNSLAPSTIELDTNIYQTSMISPRSTGVILQEYTEFNPSFLIELMISELTREEVNKGYDYFEEDLNLTVDDVQIIGKKVTTSSSDVKWTREVTSIGNSKKGVLIVTFIEENSNEEQIIEKFWESLNFIQEIKE